MSAAKPGAVASSNSSGGNRNAPSLTSRQGNLSSNSQCSAVSSGSTSDPTPPSDPLVTSEIGRPTDSSAILSGIGLGLESMRDKIKRQESAFYSALQISEQNPDLVEWSGSLRRLHVKASEVTKRALDSLTQWEGLMVGSVNLTSPLDKSVAQAMSSKAARRTLNFFDEWTSYGMAWNSMLYRYLKIDPASAKNLDEHIGPQQYHLTNPSDVEGYTYTHNNPGCRSQRCGWWLVMVKGGSVMVVVRDVTTWFVTVAPSLGVNVLVAGKPSFIYQLLVGGTVV
ncbi:hypothetical protein TREMEDRAFT_59948 [Tremella mesenterica DSM 1558]|uniref:uncharacterized protein n=1 Tax=Tremella mesenterica (strain ATCC 24925 / CBS 8224 / DSM 1558 / NBRC 9311 / NRRL Y-6157 / RJB 2259-6 / UBC 559-6) TaxID=578456 RepID=UPI0003F49D99|nr:uncharacterized protein TREMEDRAFT_59948 [Tremella mesenterica DSM 1558]EIW71005.1 hypothetical protein TREMEDRAFT_59948 [Tremella mesenterica DSM 1558]